MSEAEGWKEMCRVLADAHNMLDQRDALIRELVTALWRADGVIWRRRQPAFANIHSDIEAALAKAKVAGYEQ